MKGQHNIESGIKDYTAIPYRIQSSSSTLKDGDSISRLNRVPGSRTPSFDAVPLSRAHTTSTTSSDGVSRLAVTRTVSVSSHKDDTDIELRDFSNSKYPRRTASSETSKNRKEFQYYGRHANTWLFNDWSVTDSVKKGWGKVFSRGNGGDWYTNR